MAESESREITPEQYHAIIGAAEIIRIYDQTITDTARLVAGIVGAEDESNNPAFPYWGILTDELSENRPGKQTADVICRRYNLTVKEPDA